MDTVKEWQQLNGLALAYMGDGIYEWYIRRHVLSKGMTQVHQLHQEATKYVSAKAQAYLVKKMLDQNDFLTPEEQSYYKRGRNSKSHTKAKNADVVTYRLSTGFEALMAYWYFSGQMERLEQVIQWCINQVEENL